MVLIKGAEFKHSKPDPAVLKKQVPDLPCTVGLMMVLQYVAVGLVVVLASLATGPRPNFKE